MQNALKLNVQVGEDHLVRLPDEVPVGRAEIIVLVDESSELPRPRRAGSAAGRVHMAPDFDAPLDEFADYQ